ncbi:helix-turn-helix transcriptional regulator [Luteococcus peritonei]|uniref:Helix-turn-helix transcriptional regulator n=1 Tax=Luteococcus peritonei TaxID=88874 RepID=A0ABW4RR81_9ACTN
MTLGSKLREARNRAGMTQADLAQALCVSRQAITKWESDKGMPDIVNLAALADLLDCSIDSLVRTDRPFSAEAVRVPIVLDSYRKVKPARSKQDMAVREVHPDAEVIHPLLRRREMTRWENLLDFITQPGVIWAADGLSNRDAYYLVEKGATQQLARVSKDYVETRDLPARFEGRTQVIGQDRFSKVRYTL